MGITPESPLPPPIEEAPEWLPLSFAQQRLWFLDRLHPNSPAYNIPVAFRLRGPLDVAALERSLGALIARHEILRTVYSERDGEPRQQIKSAKEFNLTTTDLAGVNNQSVDAAEKELRAHLRREAERPFDLANDLMLRAKLFTISDADHVLFLNAHHIAFDEWSMQILWREIQAAYESFLQGRPPPFEELPIQYADFAIWQRESAPGWAGEEQYWRERLAGPLPRVELPAARSRTESRSDRGERETLVLPRDLSAELRSFARREGVTMHVLLMAAFQTLLRRFCPHDDIVIGSPVAGRTHFQTEPLIGFFVNTLPMRLSFAGNPTFRELLHRARQMSLEACEHQQVPFERIVDAAKIDRGSGGNPIFDVVFSTQHIEPPRGFGGLAVEALELETGTAKFELTFVAQDRGEDLSLTSEYSTDLFDAARVRQMLACYEGTLRSILAQPEASVATLSLPEAQAAPAPAESSRARLRPTGPALPPTLLQRKLLDIWKNVLGHSSFGPSDNFFEVGGHSLLAVKLIAQIEKVLGKNLPLPILFKAPTIEKMAAVLAEEKGPALGSCLVEIQPAGSKPPIFWLHTLGGGGGGGLFTYRKLAEELGPDQPSYGFVASAEPFDSIEAMAARYIEEMRAVQPSGPYRLGGYCFGGVVAYEMARQLEAAGQPVGVLALLDSSPPDPTGERTRPSLKLAWHAVTSFPAWLRHVDRDAVKRIAARFRSRLGRRRRPPHSSSGAGEPPLEQFVDMTHYPADYKRFAQAHWKALMRYTPGQYRGPATLFKTDERHLFHLDSLAGWRKLVGSGLEVRRVTGKHEQILESPHVQKLAAQIRQLLA